jgi:aldose 1-epimerase
VATLLHPWANRLSAERFSVRGRAVDAFGAWHDENGVVLHGLDSARRGWIVEHADAASVRARRSWHDDAFPFPHEVAVEHRLTARGLETTTDVLGDTPAVFGWHPFLRLPGVPRERWEPPPFELADREFDEALAEIDGTFVLEAEGRRVEVEFIEGAPYGQFFAPRGEPVACFEPMIAPTNSLVTGDALAWAPWRMRFEIRIG